MPECRFGIGIDRGPPGAEFVSLSSAREEELTPRLPPPTHLCYAGKRGKIQPSSRLQGPITQRFGAGEQERQKRRPRRSAPRPNRSVPRICGKLRIRVGGRGASDFSSPWRGPAPPPGAEDRRIPPDVRKRASRNRLGPGRQRLVFGGDGKPDRPADPFGILERVWFTEPATGWIGRISPQGEWSSSLFRPAPNAGASGGGP